MANELIKYDAACKALAAAKSVDEVKGIHDKAEAMRAYARQAKNKELEIDAAEIRIRAERRIGELITAQKELPKESGGGLHEGGRPKKTGTKSEPVLSDSVPTLSEMGIDKKLSSRSQKLAAVPEKKFESQMSEWREKVSKEAERVTTNLMKEGEKERAKQSKINEYKKAAKDFSSDDIKIENTDFYDYAEKQIGNDSIDAIITDPPYPGKYLPLWEKLFETANRVLKPSAFLIAYSGQMYLDKIFRMKNELLYYWTMNIVFSKKPLIQGRNIINEWKPILFFQKTPFKKISDTVSDTVSFDYTERDMHKENWGQTVKPFELLIERFTKPNDLIFEPFAGTGTTLIAAKNMKRRCIGCEIDKQYIDLIKGRLADE
jgi:16S rRNA G966 N2-methylase RsmD